MEKSYILKGDPKEVDKVIRENRIRANRGVISFTPVEPDKADVSDKIAETAQEIAKAKEAAEESVKAFAELAVQLVNTAVEHGAELPEDMQVQLAELGVSVPETSESVPKNPDSAQNEPENVPETTDSVPENENPEQMDGKTLEVEDLKEVDLDADDKTLDNNDSKDVSAADTKETKTAKKTSKPSKKSE